VPTSVRFFEGYNDSPEGLKKRKISGLPPFGLVEWKTAKNHHRERWPRHETSGHLGILASTTNIFVLISSSEYLNSLFYVKKSKFLNSTKLRL
jgi:hypothetical protein